MWRARSFLLLTHTKGISFISCGQDAAESTKKKRTKEKGTSIALSSPKVRDFSGLRELAMLKQRAALVRKTADFGGALLGAR